jgi:hypothetical protein
VLEHAISIAQGEKRGIWSISSTHRVSAADFKKKQPKLKRQQARSNQLHDVQNVRSCASDTSQRRRGCWDIAMTGLEFVA